MAHDDRGSVGRPLLWLVGGLVVFVLLIPLLAPELVFVTGRDGGAVLGDALTVIALAAVPGVLLLGVLAVRRRRAERAAGHGGTPGRDRTERHDGGR
jgi:hypothetical protein